MWWQLMPVSGLFLLTDPLCQLWRGVGRGLAAVSDMFM